MWHVYPQAQEQIRNDKYGSCRQEFRQVPRTKKAIGVASDSSEIEVLEGKARAWIEHYTEQMSLDFDEDIRLHNIYRYMDSLYDSQREKVQQISVAHTLKVLGGRIGLVFYDVTTLYFEAKPKPEDELRQAGFSKDGKTAESQIVLGLLVSEDGYPLSYSIFNGSQYEDRTMIPVIDDFVQRFSLTDFVVVSRLRSDERKEYRIAGDRRVQVHHRSKDTQ